MDMLKKNQALIDKKFNEVLKLAKGKKEGITRGLLKCSELEKSFMKFLYISMPLSDIANYDFDLFLSYARHAAFLTKNVSWAHEIPEDIFLNYVLYYRVNNENIEDCRKTLYDLIKDRIKNKNMMDAALEINYWCLEQMAYKSTDERTASPLTCLKSAYGRCGEESTFAVTALRSAGIPARQVYVPRWSHCDDNHAWVEVYCGGSWHYFGACEPEPVFNKGWFNAAASRAMLVTNRIFSPIFDETDAVPQSKLITIKNNIKRYADCRKFTVKVVDKNNAPVPDVKVNFQILNCSEFSTAISLKTGKDGKASITTGLGSININAVKSGKFINRLVNTAEEDFVALNLDEAGVEDNSTDDFDIITPNDNMNFTINLKPEEKIIEKERFEKSSNLRKERESKFYDEERAEKAAEKYGEDHEIIKNVLIKSKGNYKEIERFLNDSKYDTDDKIGILKVLLDKDYLDITKEKLDSHIKYSTAYKGKYPKDLYRKYIMNPRIYYENITDYRKFILDYFSPEDKLNFKENPKEIFRLIQSSMTENPEIEYDTLYTNPAGALSVKSCSKMSKKILFTAICRTLGIPARINKEDLSVEYFRDGSFIKIAGANGKGNGLLILESHDEAGFVYMQNWTLGVLKDGEFITLNLEDKKWTNGRLVLSLIPGNYRIITTNRIPDGNILARKYSFTLSGGEEKKIAISKRAAKLTDMLKNVMLQDFKLYDENGNSIMAQESFKGNINAVLWLKEGSEPTEHVLNEMISLKDVLNSADFNIIFILKNKNSLSNEKLSEAIAAIPEIKTYYDYDCSGNDVARRMYLEPDALPLIIVSNGLDVFYSFSGYNVGIIDLLIKIIRTVKDN